MKRETIALPMKQNNIRWRCALIVFGFLGLNTGVIWAQQSQAIIGVGEIQTSIRGADPLSFQTMIETQLVKANKFKIIERSRLAEILKEKNIGAAGLTTGSNNSFSGIQGVDYLIYGTITKLGASGSASSVQGMSFGGKTVEMAVDLRIIDAHNGEITLAETVGEQISAGNSFSGFGVSNSKKEADPLADVQRLAAKSISALITTKIYPIRIIAKQGDGTIVVNYGDSVLSKDDVLRVFKLGLVGEICG
jgi:curli biogenesis system outer membrane secretion channel CsgG